MMGPGYLMDPTYASWMMVGSALFWLLLAAIACFAIVRFSPRRDRGEAITILQERLARGEIDADEYSSRRRLILER